MVNLNGSNWPLCKALHNGHYVKCPFMHNTLQQAWYRIGLMYILRAGALHNFPDFKTAIKVLAAQDRGKFVHTELINPIQLPSFHWEVGNVRRGGLRTECNCKPEMMKCWANHCLHKWTKECPLQTIAEIMSSLSVGVPCSSRWIPVINHSTPRHCA
jgi:hypothetical protein